MTTTPGGPAPGVPGVNVTIPSYVFENCTGVGYAVQIPADLVTDDVPDEFGPSSSVPFFANLGLAALTCPRVVHGNQVFPAVATLWTHLNVIPTNDSWEDSDALSVYGFDVLISNSTLAEQLRGSGIPAVEASIEKESIGAPDVASQQQWTFRTNSVEFVVTFHQDTESQNTGLERDLYYWFGKGPFLRIYAHTRTDFYRVFAPDAGSIQVSGESAFGAALMTPVSAASGSAIYSTTWEIDSIPKGFGN